MSPLESFSLSLSPRKEGQEGGRAGRIGVTLLKRHHQGSQCRAGRSYPPGEERAGVFTHQLLAAGLLQGAIPPQAVPADLERGHQRAPGQPAGADIRQRAGVLSTIRTEGLSVAQYCVCGGGFQEMAEGIKQSSLQTGEQPSRAVPSTPSRCLMGHFE